VRDDELWFHGMILRPDGSEMLDTMRVGGFTHAVALGADAGMELKGRAPTDFFQHE
jgi:hydroxymethylbilane synthase